MEDDLPLHVLSIKMCSCEKCSKRFKKRLFKMPGVESVSVDTENNLVYVVGRINGTTLVKEVAKLGKSVQLVSADEQKHKGSSSNFAAPEKGKPHMNCCCVDGRHNNNSEKKVEQKEEHICEAYVPPVIDPRVCRDFHCKTHPRGRVIVDRVPPENTSTFFGMGGLQMGDFRYYGGYNPYAGGSYPFPQQYGYGWQPQPHPHLPQHPYIFQ